MRYIFIMLASCFLLTNCAKEDKNTITVGTIAGPETALMQEAKKVAKEKYGLTIRIKEFNDYTMPNIALNDDSLDVNVYQHLPYLNATIKSRGYPLVSIGNTYIYPMAIYSKKINTLQQLKKDAVVAIPNDPSNEVRALLLLQKAHLITLKKGTIKSANDVETNPKHLQIKTLDAAQLPRALDDVTLAVINTNYAVAFGLSPKKDSLFIEDKHSPYANIIVVKEKNKNKKKVQLFVKALHDKKVEEKARTLFHGEAIKAY